MKTEQGYYGIAATVRNGQDVWLRFKLRDARAAERFYRRPPEGKVVAVGYRRTYRTIPIVTGWTLNGTGAEAQLFTHGAQDIFTVPQWARRARR